MRDFTRFRLFAVAAGVLLSTGSAVALPTKDSGLFNHQYNGDTASAAADSVYGAFTLRNPNFGAPNGSEPVTDGDLLTYDAIGGSSYWEATNWNYFNAVQTGYTFEMRVKISNDVNLNAENPNGSVQMVLFDTNGWMAFRVLRAGGVRIFNTSVTYPTPPNDDGFHTFRVAREADGFNWRLWRDGESIGVHPVSNPPQPFAFPDYQISYWGDGGSDVGGPLIQIDYVRYDSTGAYEPSEVPPVVAGDFDSDGDVDGADFVAWQTHFPKTSGAALDQGDADGDGDVDGADFVVWQTNFPHTTSEGISPVPELPSGMLFAFGLIVAHFCLLVKRMQ